MSTVRQRWLHNYKVARTKLKKAQDAAAYARRVVKRHPVPKPKPVEQFGIDWAWGTPNIPELAKAHVKFVCRYLSEDSTKNLTLTQARALKAHGIDCVVVWETSANRALAGRNAGMADAAKAQALAMAAGKPAGKPIYFAVDFNATESAIDAYFSGVEKVLGKNRTGAYGGYSAIKGLFDAGRISYGWQTYAWSGNPTNWDARAQIQQYSNGHRLGGVSCDYDRSKHSDFGQWRP